VFAGPKEVAAPQTIPPAKKAHPLVIIGGAVVIVLIIIGALARGGRGSTSPASSPANHSVMYKVYGTTTSASLTYQNAQGGTEQKDVRLPWQLSLTGRNGQFVYISAQNNMESGSVACEIFLDGVSVKQSSSNGAYKIATCDGRI
jgi:hypothetical protein